MRAKIGGMVLALLCGCASAEKRPAAGGGSDETGSGGETGGKGGGTGGKGETGGAGGDAGTGGSAGAIGGAMGTMPDAAAPEGGGGGAPVAGALETVEVPASGTAVTMKTSLDAGEIFLLKATGSADFGAQKVDAEFAFGAGMPADEMGTTDYGVDIGMKQIHPKVHTTVTPPGPGRMKWLPTIGYREDHVYYMTVTGEGMPLALKLGKPEGAGTGTITVSLIRLSPMPATLGTELETVMIPFTKTVVSATKPTELGKLYVLQSSGEGKVSSGGKGDSEYMDYDAAGTKYNEGESGADFGVGVDEIEVGLQPRGPGGYKPRLRWWGPFRKDHTYYMVFAGTGKPIQFLYFDSGYGDNGPMDKIPLKIFNAP